MSLCRTHDDRHDQGQQPEDAEYDTCDRDPVAALAARPDLLSAPRPRTRPTAEPSQNSHRTPKTSDAMARPFVRATGA
jgi:hypothetical protein